MQITVNGEIRDTQAQTLEELCADLGYGEMKVATALNGEFVPALRRPGTHISPDDRVEIVAPRQGG